VCGGLWLGGGVFWGGGVGGGGDGVVWWSFDSTEGGLRVIAEVKVAQRALIGGTELLVVALGKGSWGRAG